MGMVFSQINVTLDQTIREVPLFGIANSSMRYNNYNGSGVEYDFGEQDFEKATECINPHVMTFPSANPCYFDWNDGWALDSAEIVDYVNTLDLPYTNYHDANSNGEHFFNVSNEDYEWWENADGTWNKANIDITDFSNFINTNDVKGTFSLNMITSSIETTMNMVRDNFQAGVSFEHIELGSEYYLRSGGDKWDDVNGNFMYDVGEELTKDKDDDGNFDPGRFEFIYPTPESFALECNKYIDSLSNILPSTTKFAVTSKNKSGDPRSDDWTRQVLKHIDSSLIDTIYLSWHEYLRFEKKDDDAGNQDTLTAEQVLAFPQFRYEDMITASGMNPGAIEALENELDLKIKIWLTESAFRELGEKPWIYKWAQSLVNIQNYSLMLTNSYIEIIMLQALHGYSSTSAINHGYAFPDDFPPYTNQDSCSPYGRTATAFSIYFWNYISEGMTHMQELNFENTNGDHRGVILVDPFDGDSELDNPLSPEVGYEYAYLMGWKFNNTSNGEERAIIINIADTPKTIQYDSNSPLINNSNLRCIQITSLNSSGEPSIDQYITGDNDLSFDTTNVFSGMVLPPYSINLFEPYAGSSYPWYVSNEGSDIEGNGSAENPFASIQKGIDIAVNGDTVLVLSGTYQENVNFNGKNIFLTSLLLQYPDSLSLIDSTIIDGNQTGRVITLNNGENSTAHLFGFTIQNGSVMTENSDGGGIMISNSSPTLEYLKVINNSSSDDGGGISFHINGGISSSPSLRNILIANNSSSDDGGGVHIVASDPIFYNVTIVNNHSGGSGGGINIGSSQGIPSNVNIVNSIIWNNSSSWNNVNSNLSITYSNIENGFEGIGNINSDPLFCDNENSNFTLAENSPCVETGENGVNMGALGVGCEEILSNENDVIPSQYSLHTYPNPFNPVAKILFSIPQLGLVSIKVYDITGREIETLANRNFNPGNYSINWNASAYPSGIYFVRMATGVYIKTQKVVLIK
jgi:hypothetical protein